MFRGIFNLFLSTVVINDVNITFNSDNGTSTFEVITYIIASCMATIGFIYLGLFFWTCCKKGKEYFNKSEITATTVDLNDDKSWKLLRTNHPEYIKWLQS